MDTEAFLYHGEVYFGNVSHMLPAINMQRGEVTAGERRVKHDNTQYLLLEDGRSAPINIRLVADLAECSDNYLMCRASLGYGKTREI